MRTIHPTKLAILTALVACGACSKDQTKADSTVAMRDTTAAAAAMATPATGAAAMATPADSTAHNNGWTDGQILGFAHAANDGEVSAGQLAEKKATNAGVKALARQMVADHRAMLAEGAAFATKNNVTPDTTKDVVRDAMKDGRDELKDLTDKAAGADWDKSFLDREIGDHQKTLDKLQDAAKNTTNTDLRAMLVKATGKVQEHLTKAKSLKEKYPS